MPSIATNSTIQHDTVSGAVVLSSVREPQVCQVTKFDLLPEDEARLKNMGICVGRRIEILQVGDPLIVKVSGASVGVSRRLAHGIEVRLASGDHDSDCQSHGAGRESLETAALA